MLTMAAPNSWFMNTQRLTVITRTVCRTGLFPKLFRQNNSDYLTPVPGSLVRGSKKLSKKKKKITNDYLGDSIIV